MDLMKTLGRDLRALHATGNKQKPLFAVFPDGTRSKVQVFPRTGGCWSGYKCKTPNGNVESNTTLRDLKVWLEKDWPGIIFERAAK